MLTNFKDLAKISRKHKNSRIVFARGTFDILHVGHIDFLKQLKKFGDIVVVGVTNDKRVRGKKGHPRPIIKDRDRVRMIDSIKYVDYAFVIPSMRKRGQATLTALKNLKPAFFVADEEKVWWKDEKGIKDIGIKLKTTTKDKNNSTTKIINTIIKKHKK